MYPLEFLRWFFLKDLDISINQFQHLMFSLCLILRLEIYGCCLCTFSFNFCVTVNIIEVSFNLWIHLWLFCICHRRTTYVLRQLFFSFWMYLSVTHVPNLLCCIFSTSKRTLTRYPNYIKDSLRIVSKSICIN